MKSAALLYSQETHPFFRGFFGLHLLPVPIIVETVDPFSISTKWLTNCPFAYFSDPLTIIPETEAQTKRTTCHHIPIFFCGDISDKPASHFDFYSVDVIILAASEGFSTG